MKHHTIRPLFLAAALLTGSPCTLADMKPGEWLDQLDACGPPENLPAYKQAAYRNLGLQWGACLKLSAWHADHTDTGTTGREYLLADLQLTQRVLADTGHGGTWLRAQFSGRAPLSHRTRHGHALGEGAACIATPQWKREKKPNYGIPECSVIQFLNHRRSGIIAGVLDTSNYLDLLCTSAGFANGALNASSVLPMPDGNVGIIIQQELGHNDFIQIAASYTGSSYLRQDNPFRNRELDGFCVVAEYGLWHGDSTEYRIAPFYRHLSAAHSGGLNRDAFGIECSVDCDLSHELSMFARAGYCLRQQDAPTAEISLGFKFYPFADSDADFLGLAASLAKGCPPYGRTSADGAPAGGQDHRRECAVELMYSWAVAPHMTLLPHAEYIFRPSGAATPAEFIGGMQVAISF